MNRYMELMRFRDMLAGAGYDMDAFTDEMARLWEGFTEEEQARARLYTYELFDARPPLQRYAVACTMLRSPACVNRQIWEDRLTVARAQIPEELLRYVEAG